MRKQEPVTYRYFINGEQVDVIPEEVKKELSRRMYESFNTYFSNHPDEYARFAKPANAQ